MCPAPPSAWWSHRYRLVSDALAGTCGLWASQTALDVSEPNTVLPKPGARTGLSQVVCPGPFHMSPRGLWSDQVSLWALLSAPSGWALGTVLTLAESQAAREAYPEWTGGLWWAPMTWAAPPCRAPAGGRKTQVCPLTVQQPCLVRAGRGPPSGGGGIRPPSPGLFHPGLSQDVGYTSLHSTVGPCCLSILYRLVCTC